MEAIVASMLPLSGAAVLGPWPLVLAAFAIGACVGSFLNVCIHRLPAEQSVVAPRSRCPHCHTPIAWYDNVPVLSWLWLAARCRACGASIAARYPIVEAATGLLGILALAAFGPTPQAVLVFAFTAALLLVSVIDLDHRFIPDEVSKPGIAIGILASMLPGGIGLFDALAGACLGGGILWAVAWSYERSTGVEGMGFGDVKLLAMIGAFEGWTAIPAVLVIASLSGSLVGVGLIVLRLVSREGRRVGRRFGAPALLTFARRALRRTAIPFGPFLALGGMLVLYLPDFVGFSFFRF